MRIFVRFGFAAALAFGLGPHSVFGQGDPTRAKVVSLPIKEMTRIASPDGKWTLVFECPKDCSERKLYIDGVGANPRRLVSEYSRSLDISWSADSRHFFVNDVFGSNGALSYVYEPTTLNVTNISELLVARIPAAKKFLDAGHSYLKVKHWMTSSELLVVLYGHFDDPPPRAFTVLYQVNLDGQVRQISEQPTENSQ